MARARTQIYSIRIQRATTSPQTWNNIQFAACWLRELKLVKYLAQEQNTTTQASARTLALSLRHAGGQPRPRGAFPWERGWLGQCLHFVINLLPFLFRYEIFLDEVKPESLSLPFLKEFMSLPTSYFAAGASFKYRKLYTYQLMVILCMIQPRSQGLSSTALKSKREAGGERPWERGFDTSW